VVAVTVPGCVNAVCTFPNDPPLNDTFAELYLILVPVESNAKKYMNNADETKVFHAELKRFESLEVNSGPPVKW
jgi:hypothetical protein